MIPREFAAVLQPISNLFQQPTEIVNNRGKIIETCF
uniref:Uncharacterized protein n=1 Tax=Schistosoma curassoni TaxID=6186 RepID=A0A183KYI4_9TREM